MIHELISRNIKLFELIGVMMRISSFTIVSIMEKDSPFLFIWIVNTLDAVLLTWCSMIKKDQAYIILNAFWILIGIIGIYRTL